MQIKFIWSIVIREVGREWHWIAEAKKIHIFEGQTISFAQLQHESQQVHDELEEWRSKCTNLEADIQKLYGEMETAINEKNKEISDLRSKNEELLSYIERLEKSQDLQHKGKDISEVIKNQER